MMLNPDREQRQLKTTKKGIGRLLGGFGLAKGTTGIFISLFIGSLLVMLYGYFQGYDLSIPWSVTTTAESEKVVVHQFNKGPFAFEFSGEKYSLAETFTAGAIRRDYNQDALFLSLIFFGICLLISVSTFLSRMWFIGISGLFIFFIINLRLQDVGLFGFAARSSLPVVIILTGYMVPAYLFHAFFTEVKYTYRLLTLLAVSSLIVLFSQVEMIAFQEQIIAGSYFGLVIIALLFLLLIAEENIFAILYLITKSKGGKNNHLHFITFSIAYLVFLGAYYSKKSSLLSIELTYFDPYLLLATSSMVALWSLKFKKDLFENIISATTAQLLFVALGIVTFGFLGLSFFRGNDPVYEGLHYFIVYVHLGFGTMFFFYLLLNFIDPLSKGLQVFKIAYREQNFPYVSAKLAGLVTVTGFFFLADKEAFLLFRAGHYNYQGTQAETANEIPLAQEYYREGSIYGFDNHFSNYKMAYHQLRQQDVDEANYRFGRATLRYPSAQSFVNQSGTFAMEGETTQSLVSLKSGLQEFPENDQLLNNLGLIYLDLKDTANALGYLKKSDLAGKWTNASLVNLWKISPLTDTASARKDYEAGNLSVKANILDRFLKNSVRPGFTFDSTALYPSYPLHRLAFLINSSWYFQDNTVNVKLEEALTGMMDEQLYRSARHALALNNYLTGEVNKALFTYDLLQHESTTRDQGKYLSEPGLIALEQHALPNALDFFDKAIENGNQEALLNKTATLLEMGRLDDAIQWTKSLVATDSGYHSLLTDLENINHSADDLTHLYYFYHEYSLPEMIVRLNEASPEFISSLWQKICAELLVNEAYEQLIDYQDLFKPYLPSTAFAESQLLIGLHHGTLTANDHPLSKALQQRSEEAKAEALIALANKNALNVPVLLAAVNELDKVNENEAYKALLDAYRLNRFSPGLIKAYIKQCLKMNLTDYITPPLNRLAELVPGDAYFDYVDEVNRRLEQIEKENDW